MTVEIEAAALNFRDVMISLSLLPEQSYERSYFGKNLGMEAAGVVSAVGAAVANVKVGDRVVIGEPRVFANRVNVKAERVGPLVDGVSLVDAAATQSVYNTCQHSLINLARIRRGERVLVHSAAGGIGHAAIAVCQHVGAEVIATAGSEEKRELVRRLGVRHVFDSRSTAWCVWRAGKDEGTYECPYLKACDVKYAYSEALVVPHDHYTSPLTCPHALCESRYEGVMKATDGEGVDVVLNSLAGVHQRLGLQVLRSSGRFCEIGKVRDDVNIGSL